MPKVSSKRRVLAHYDFENGSSVEISCTGDIETAAALKAATTLLAMKQDELGKPRQLTPLKAAAG